jgi:8-amino-7-oxononanoate synthase
MLDFTSALYLGLRHGSASLRPWRRLTTGVPAALAEAPEARAVASRLATLQGCDRAVVCPSTLHLFWDLLPILTAGEARVFVEAETYPIASWGIERVAARGVRVDHFAHHDPDDLRRRLRQHARRRFRPVVVADGLCVDCGQPAPLKAYLESVREAGGVVVIDDSQGLGLLGERPGPRRPYGSGGGGSLRLHGLAAPEIVVGASLAKGFGVPVAALSGGRSAIRDFTDRSETRVHSTPASVAVLRAAEHALDVNEVRGDELRLHLAGLVARFRDRLRALDLRSGGGRLPVQTPVLPRGADAVELHRALRREGVATVLRNGTAGAPPRITFVLTAGHALAEVDAGVAALHAALRSTSRVLLRGARA